MSRTGVEPKPRWATLPPEVRGMAEATLGSRVCRAARVWGGYTPTPTYRLRLADGRRAFFKAIGPADNDFARAAHAREERIYRELADVIAPWAPALLGAFHCGVWMALLLEDLGPKSAPPWTSGLARGVSRALGDFHASTLGRSLPDFLPRPERYLLTERRLWGWARDAAALAPVAGLAGERADEAARWLEAFVPALASASRALADVGERWSLVHQDARSDNLRWLSGRLVLLDWPHAAVGPAEDDAAAFAQSVAVEGGPDPERVMAWYAERAPVRTEVLDAAVASWASFFAFHAPQPEIPGLPRLRTFQRRQLAVTLAWASRRLGLPEPTCVAGIGG